MGKETNGQIKCVKDHHELKNGVVWKEMKVGMKGLLDSKDEWFENDTEGNADQLV